MKALVQKQKRPARSPRANKIMQSLRNARKQAIKTARQYRTPIVYLRDGKIVKERA